MVDDTGVLRDLIKEARSRRPLQPGEQARLLHEAARGDTASQDRVVAAYLPTLVRLAGARGEVGLSVSDLVQEGSIGLIEAVRTFEASGEADFAAFAEARISAQLTSALEAEALSVRDEKLLVAAAEDYARTELLLARMLRRRPVESEIAEKLEWTVDRTRYVAQVVAEAQRRHDEELLAYVDPEAIGMDGESDDGDGPADDDDVTTG